MNMSLRNIAIIVVLVKILQLVVPFISFQILPFQLESAYRGDNLGYPSDEPIGWKTTFKTWDASSYLYLAKNGYEVGGIANQMPPLFPFLINLAKRVVGSFTIAGLMLNNLFSFLALIGLYQLTRSYYDEAVASKTILYALCFPSSFFFSRVYSEGLFLCLTVFLFYFLSRHKYGRAALCALLLPLARTIGVFIVLPVLAYLFFDKKGAVKAQGEGADTFKKITVCVAPLFGLSIAMFFFYQTTGNWFELFEAHRINASQHSIANLFRLKEWLYDNFIHLHWQWHGTDNSAFDRLAFFLFLILLYRIFREQNMTMFVYALVFGMVPALSDHFMSYARFLIIIFPLFIQMALDFRHHRIILALMLLSQLKLLAFHSLGYWVA